jgi:hypothetical protein
MKEFPGRASADANVVRALHHPAVKAAIQHVEKVTGKPLEEAVSSDLLSDLADVTRQFQIGKSSDQGSLG